MRSWSIGSRLVVGTAVAAALVLAAAFITARIVTEQVLHSSAVQLARTDLEAYAADLRTQGPDDLDPVGTGLLIEIHEPDGSQLVSSMPHDVHFALPRTASGEFDFRDDEGRSYVVVGETVRTSAGDWSLWAARDTGTLDSSLPAIDLVFVVTGLVLLAVLIAASWLLVRGALRPVERMRAAAEAIEGDATLPVDGRGDELDRLAATLNDFLERERASAQRERRMVSDAAHELRTPIAALGAQLELARRHADDTARPSDDLARPAGGSAGDSVQLRDELARAAASARRLGDLATRLLELARLDEGHAVGEATAAVLQDAALACVDAARARVATSGGGSASAAVELEITAELHDPEARCPIDAVSFGRIVDNLVENAIRAVGPAGSIGVELRDDDDALLLRVDDDGPGIDPDFLPHAFERFRRGRPQGEEGSGLGLALVASLAAAAGGTAAVENLERGVRAEVRVPKM